MPTLPCHYSLCICLLLSCLLFVINKDRSIGNFTNFKLQMTDKMKLNKKFKQTPYSLVLAVRIIDKVTPDDSQNPDTVDANENDFYTYDFNNTSLSVGGD